MWISRENRIKNQFYVRTTCVSSKAKHQSYPEVMQRSMTCIRATVFSGRGLVGRKFDLVA